MPKRNLRIVTQDVPIIGICEACNTQFKSFDVNEAERIIKDQFDPHECKPLDASQADKTPSVPDHLLSRGRNLKGFAPNPLRTLCTRLHRVAGPTGKRMRRGAGFLHFPMARNLSASSGNPRDKRTDMQALCFGLITEYLF